jgi:hypothetical protein
MKEQTWKEKCIDLMIHAETHDDKELQDGLAWLASQALKDNTTIYEKIKEVLIKHHEKKNQNTLGDKSK